MKNVLVILAVCLSFGLFAQPTVQQKAVDFINLSKGKVLGLVDKFTDAQLDWRPGEGVRSTREVLLHIAGTNYFLMGQSGFPLPDGMDPWALEKKPMDKAAITQTLTDSYEFITTHILEIPDSQFGDVVTFPFPGEYDKLFAIMLGVDHCAEHLGQLIAYARVNGVAPPWSEGGN